MHTAATPRARSDGLSEPSPPLKPDIRKIADAGGVRVITVAEHGDGDQVRRCRILPDRSATQASDSRNRLLKIAFDEHRVACGDPTPIVEPFTGQGLDRLDISASEDRLEHSATEACPRRGAEFAGELGGGPSIRPEGSSTSSDLLERAV